MNDEEAKKKRKIGVMKHDMRWWKWIQEWNTWKKKKKGIKIHPWHDDDDDDDNKSILIYKFKSPRYLVFPKPTGKGKSQKELQERDL